MDSVLFISWLIHFLICFTVASLPNLGEIHLMHRCTYCGEYINFT